MKHLSQITLIATVSFAGELLHYLLPLPVPGSIYGLVLMLLLLMTRVIRVDQVKTVGDWLITLMPVMFVGPTVGLMSSYDSYKDFLIPVFAISLVTTVITMAASGLTAQGLIRLREKKEGSHHDA
ncbi:MAG: CidA/LrgA family protein [Ruminococcus bromii]|nr:CidA/LrgA family protein [Ruminococcus bromii]